MDYTTRNEVGRPQSPKRAVGDSRRQSEIRFSCSLSATDYFGRCNQPRAVERAVRDRHRDHHKELATVVEPVTKYNDIHAHKHTLSLPSRPTSTATRATYTRTSSSLRRRNTTGTTTSTNTSASFTRAYKDFRAALARLIEYISSHSTRRFTLLVKSQDKSEADLVVGVTIPPAEQYIHFLMSTTTMTLSMAAAHEEASCCPNCGYALANELAVARNEEMMRALEAQKQIEELQAQVRMLTQKATAAGTSGAVRFVNVDDGLLILLQWTNGQTMRMNCALFAQPMQRRPCRHHRSL